jgi:CubicO group peptidase (beta-lactamase class C family)
MSYDYTGSSRRDILKGIALGSVALALGEGGRSATAQAGRGRKLPRTTAGSAGVSPEAVAAFIDAVNAKVGGLHSFMLLRHGQVAAEGWWAPYAPALPHMLYSLSKSFTSTAVGFAVADGKLTVEDTVLSFFPSEAPANPEPNLAAMRVRHLLTMNTGHDKDATGPTTAAKDGNWVKAFLSLPVEHQPGSKFVYNSAATYMLSAIVQKLTGMTVLDYLTPRLFQPLGIESPTWETCPRGINTGGWGLSVRTEDIARFGQCYLQKGKWNGKQVVPEAWVSAATTKQVSNGDGGESDWTQGYGYQFWRCRHGAFRGDGAFGQYCVVMPEQDAVLAITSGVGDMQAVLNSVWDHLLPGIGSTSADADESALKEKIASLTVPPPPGKPVSPTAARVSGKTYRFEQGSLRSASFTFGGDRATIALREDDSERKITAGSRSWVRGEFPRDIRSIWPATRPAGKIAARGAWTAGDTYVLRLCYVETPYVETITCRFAGDEVTLARKMNVSFGQPDAPPVTGKAV